MQNLIIVCKNIISFIDKKNKIHDFLYKNKKLDNPYTNLMKNTYLDTWPHFWRGTKLLDNYSAKDKNYIYGD